MFYFHAEHESIPEIESELTTIQVVTKDHWQKEKELQYSFSDEELDELMKLEEIGVFESAEGFYESEEPVIKVVNKLLKTGKFEQNEELTNLILSQREDEVDE